MYTYVCKCAMLLCEIFEQFFLNEAVTFLFSEIAIFCTQNAYIPIRIALLENFPKSATIFLRMFLRCIAKCHESSRNEADCEFLFTSEEKFLPYPSPLSPFLLSLTLNYSRLLFQVNTLYASRGRVSMSLMHRWSK